MFDPEALLWLRVRGCDLSFPIHGLTTVNHPLCGSQWSPVYAFGPVELRAKQSYFIFKVILV